MIVLHRFAHNPLMGALDHPRGATNIAQKPKLAGEICMQTTGSHFKNNYTFSIANAPAQHAGVMPMIEANAHAVINYLADFIQWKGTLDFVVSFGTPNQFGANGSGLLPSYGSIASSGRTIAGEEAVTGVDANGGDYDAGCWILPNTNGQLTNYGAPLYFDPNPNPYAKANIPSGSHDFFSIYLHEVMHSLGFWSTAQHAGFGQSAFDRLTQLSGGQWEFTGKTVQGLLGEPLNLARFGNRDHYSTTGALDRGAVFEAGNYEQNRWHLGKIDLAVLADLGLTTANWEYLPLTEQPDDQVFSKPGTPLDNASDQVFRGSGGLDQKRFAGNSADYKITLDAQGTVVIKSAQTGTDTYYSYERFAFNDRTLAVDINGDAGQAYRIYQAAFARTPDPGGLSFWIKEMDKGMDLIDVSRRFVDSNEFRSAYGTNPTNKLLVEKLYQNVLGRDGEPGGITFWVGELDAGRRDISKVLADFSESPENVTGVAPAISSGIWFM